MRGAKKLRSELKKACELLDKASACSGIGADEALIWWSEKGRLVDTYLHSKNHENMISAAPDLLAALKLMLCFDNLDTFDKLKAIRESGDAIAKATGNK